MKHPIQVALLIAGILMLAPTGRAQIQAGDVSMNLNGLLTAGYTGSYGNVYDSAHSLALGATGTLSGYYYDPNFLNFNVSPYYNQSRANSTSQSVFDATGVTINSGIFSGSHYPGSIAYTKAWNSEGNFGIPGIPGYTTKSNNDSFSIGWSEQVPDLPSLTVGYQRGGNDYTIFGTDKNGSGHFQTFNLRSTYIVEGFNLTGYFTKGNSSATFPLLSTPDQEEVSSFAHSTTYGFGVGHRLPWNGSWTLNYNRSDLDDDYLGYTFNGAIDTVNSNIGFQPTQKLHLQAGASYTDNLYGSIYEIVIPTGQGGTTGAGTTVLAGGNPVLLNESQASSHAWDFIGSASYALIPNMQAQVYGERRMQSYYGQTYTADSVGGGLAYARPLWGGGVNASGFVTDTQYNTGVVGNTTTLGFNANGGYNKTVGSWTASGNFNYAQNAQTILVEYTNSYWAYSASLRKRVRVDMSWSLTAGGSHTGIVSVPGTSGSGESYSAGYSWSRWLAASASWSKSTGQALQYPGGIVPTPIPPIIPPSLLVIYGGESYAFSASTTPLRRLTISAAYSHSDFNTTNTGVGYSTKTEQYNVLVQYQFRKMYFTGGVTHLSQGFPTVGTVPAEFTSYYLGLSRWFNFF